ncbi:MAG: TetR/AcrR family transcriptional regulator [Actinomycetota bacterium]|nr:TetR/AcrR family transcriptional regulator [Actinomycetota bacterium]
MKLERRPYDMTRRADKAAETRRRILEAALSLFAEKPVGEITLESIADRAEVSVQTVIRRFGSRDGVTRAMALLIEESAKSTRPTTGEVRDIVATLVAEYELFGPVILRALAQEKDVPFLAPLLQKGRAAHQEWIDETFAHALRKRRGRSRARLKGALIAALDIYTWKVLHVDYKLDRPRTIECMELLVDAVLREGDA